MFFQMDNRMLTWRIATWLDQSWFTKNRKKNSWTKLGPNIECSISHNSKQADLINYLKKPTSFFMGM